MSGKVPGTGAKTPKSVKVHKLKHFMELVMDAPKVVGSFVEPIWRGMQRHHDVVVSVDHSNKKLTTALQSEIDDGNTVVVIFIKIKNEKESIPWLDMNNDEIIRMYNEPDTRTITVAPFEMQDALGCTKAHMGTLYKQGFVVKHGRGRYDFKETCTRYIAHLKDQAKGKGGQEYSDERTLKIRAQRRAAEVELDALAGMYTLTEDVSTQGFNQGTKYRKAIESLFSMLTPALAHANTPGKIRRVVRPELNKMLTKLSLGEAPSPITKKPPKKKTTKRKNAGTIGRKKTAAK